MPRFVGIALENSLAFIATPIVATARTGLSDRISHLIGVTAPVVFANLGNFPHFRAYLAVPLVGADSRFGFNRMTSGTMPGMTRFAPFDIGTLNDGTSATPGLVCRTGFVPAVRLITGRAFPTVHTRRVWRINAITSFLAAPTIMLRAGFGLQMPYFATGVVLIDITVPGVVVRKGHVFAIGIINGMAGFTEPITLQAGFRK